MFRGELRRRISTPMHTWGKDRHRIGPLVWSGPWRVLESQAAGDLAAWLNSRYGRGTARAERDEVDILDPIVGGQAHALVVREKMSRDPDQRVFL